MLGRNDLVRDARFQRYAAGDGPITDAVDAVLEQMKMCKAILIICDDKDPICDFVMRKLVRGATYTPCDGAYTDRPHYMIYTTLTHREALQLQAFIHKENLNAFISMLSTTEVFGKGFNHA